MRTGMAWALEDAFLFTLAEVVVGWSLDGEKSSQATKSFDSTPKCRQAAEHFIIHGWEMKLATQKQLKLLFKLLLELLLEFWLPSY